MDTIFREQNVLVDVVKRCKFRQTCGSSVYSAVVLADVSAFALTQRQMVSLSLLFIQVADL